MSRTNFAWAFVGLPREQRRALTALYDFCRTVDDISDESKDDAVARKALEHWRDVLKRFPDPSVYDPPVAHELAWAVGRFPIQPADLHWIIDGVESDLWKGRYETFEELLIYCDAVASAVGFASLAIFGADRERTAAYAFATGRALQLTNILRDVASDSRRGRVYLPQADLRRFGYRDRDLALSTYNEAFQNLMRFEVERAETFYREAEAALSSEERRKLPAAELMRRIYHALLKRIEARKFNVFPRKVRVPMRRKMAIALSVWGPHMLRAG